MPEPARENESENRQSELLTCPAVSWGCESSGILELSGLSLKRAKAQILTHHYTHGLPSGKSHWLAFGSAIVVWSIPANCNIAAYLLNGLGSVWELSRLWAPDGHEKNLLTKAIGAAVKWIVKTEKPDLLVSYADPNAGHIGGVYRAASWIYSGQSEDTRNFLAPDGQRRARRSFHSGPKHMTRAQVEALGYVEVNLPGKHRYVKPVTKKAREAIL